jgi:hypothetical protein
LTERAEIVDMIEKMRSGIKVEVPKQKSEEEPTIQIN